MLYIQVVNKIEGDGQIEKVDGNIDMQRHKQIGRKKRKLHFGLFVADHFVIVYEIKRGESGYKLELAI